MEDIRLVCNATGALKAPDSVDWFFDGEPISETNARARSAIKPDTNTRKVIDK
ncbi:hypothetical protein DPMN_111695 [Dreissena polymorpha]|uniref:Ig-like domain-containing protein n=1 Tax=Dreissena polymorpha TaxID=45954 RepID=A0A9D4KFF6_DREPO|nr:hypothetical protein DPMN_111695 [Dreissena polymorpha]